MVLKQKENYSAQLNIINETGSKITGFISRLGPKHHAIILGKNPLDESIYVAESMNHGYQYNTYENFLNRYSANGDIKILVNDGKYSNVEVAQRALREMNSGGNGVYNLITNNCESFTNRAMYGHSKSVQVFNLSVGMLVSAGIFLLVKNHKKQNV